MLEIAIENLTKALGEVLLAYLKEGGFTSVLAKLSP